MKDILSTGLIQNLPIGHKSRQRDACTYFCIYSVYITYTTVNKEVILDEKSVF